MNPKTPSRKTKFKRSVIASLVWFCAILCFLYVYWWVACNFAVRDFWDPQFALKHDFLRARVKEHPGQPLWLILGTSRGEGGLHLSLVADRMAKPPAPLIFNMSLSGADLFREYTCLRRILADGPKPQRVGIEVVGVFLNHDQSMFLSEPNLLVRARRDEFNESCSLSPDRALYWKNWQESRWNPAYQYGMRQPNQTLDLRLIPIPLIWRLEKHFYDKWGWVAVPPAPIPEAEYRSAFENAKGYFWGDLEHFSVSHINDFALRKMLDLCRDNGVEAFLYRMPESSDFQNLYPPQANEAIKSYLQKIEAEYHVPLIDARSWYTDPRDYTDGHHLNATGAEKFTPRFVEEMLGMPRQGAGVSGL